MACDPENVISSTELANLKLDIATIDAVVESSLDTTTTKSGKVINTLEGQLKLLGYEPPVTYAGSIAFTTNDNTKTIDRSGIIYAPLPSALPFTTSGTWTADDENKFFVIQGLTTVTGVTKTELAAAGGSGLVGRFDSISGLLGITPTDRATYEVVGYHDGSVIGGGAFVFKPDVYKSEHDGGTVISPTVPFGSLSDFLTGVGETDPAGTGCFVRLNTETVYPTDFGARTGTVEDSTASFQATINYQEATVSDRSFTVDFRGAYQISSTLYVGAQSTAFRGGNYYRDILYYSGTGNCIEFAGGECRLENMRMLANPDTPKTNNAVLCGGNLTLTNVWFGGFVQGIEYNGGFYHKYYNAKFIDVDYPLVGYNGNNMLVSGSQFAICIDVIEVTGGTGNAIFHGCSFENVSGDCFGQGGGSTCSYSIFDNYFEGCAELLVGSRGTHIFSHNNIQTGSMVTGVRFSGLDVNAPVSVYAVANKWIVSSDGDNDAQYIYQFSGERDKLHIDDFWVPTAAPYGGAFTTQFITGAGGFNKVTGHNALTGLGLMPAWKIFSMLNGWTSKGSGGGVDEFAYKEQNGILYIRGRINGGSSTGTTVATLPQEIYERVATANTYWFHGVIESLAVVTGFIRSDDGSVVVQQQVDDVVLNIAVPLT
jgi:hypothetical protein